MDEFNNNPFNEENSNEIYPGSNQPNQQNANQFNQAPNQNFNPYNQAPQQNTNPYNQPYQQPQNGYTYNQPNTPQQGYYQQPQGYYQQPQQNYAPYPQQASTGMAVASLVLGIVSIVLGLFMFSFPPLFLAPIIGLILGIVFKCKRLPVGKGLSTAGIITSAIGLIIPLALLILVVVLLLTNGAELMEFLKQTSPQDYEELYELYGDQFPEWFSDAMRIFFK